MKTELYTDDCFKVLAYLKYGEHDLETVISPLQASFTCIALQAAIVHNSLRSFSPKNAQRGSWFFSDNCSPFSFSSPTTISPQLDHAVLCK